MEIKKINSATFLASFDINFLEKNDLTKEEFMADSDNSKLLINQIKHYIVHKFKINDILQQSYLYLINDTFYIYFKLVRKNIEINSLEDWNSFWNFISKTKYSKQIYFDKKQKQIHISSDISDNLIEILKEFC